MPAWHRCTHYTTHKGTHNLCLHDRDIQIEWHSLCLHDMGYTDWMTHNVMHSLCCFALTEWLSDTQCSAERTLISQISQGIVASPNEFQRQSMWCDWTLTIRSAGVERMLYGIVDYCMCMHSPKSSPQLQAGRAGASLSLWCYVCMFGKNATSPAGNQKTACVDCKWSLRLYTCMHWCCSAWEWHHLGSTGTAQGAPRYTSPKPSTM